MRSVLTVVLTLAAASASASELDLELGGGASYSVQAEIFAPTLDGRLAFEIGLFDLGLRGSWFAGPDAVNPGTEDDLAVPDFRAWSLEAEARLHSRGWIQFVGGVGLGLENVQALNCSSCAAPNDSTTGAGGGFGELGAGIRILLPANFTLSAEADMRFVFGLVVNGADVQTAFLAHAGYRFQL